MCGRFASARKRQELLAEFDVQRDRVTDPLQPDYNVAPTKPVYAVLTRSPKSPEEPGDAENADDGSPRAERQLRVVRWGLVPFWAKDASIGSRMINARAETVAEKPAFRRAFAKQRCLLPADGFYEWVTNDPKTGDPDAPRKQPYYIYREDGGVLAFAGLYERWHDKSLARRRPSGHAVDGHHHHHPGRGRGRPDPRPDADGDRPQPVGGLARSRGDQPGGRARTARPGRRHAPDVTRCFDGR